MAWMENIVEIGFVFQNRGTKHFKTCGNYGPAPESDERTCWSCLCTVGKKKNHDDFAFFDEEEEDGQHYDEEETKGLLG